MKFVTNVGLLTYRTGTRVHRCREKLDKQDIYAGLHNRQSVLTETKSWYSGAPYQRQHSEVIVAGNKHFQQQH